MVSFSGAGLSAESGVPTFRDAQTGGLWAKHDPMRLASPQGFAEDPQLVSQWYAHRRRAIADAQPNGAHIALARHPEMIHVTQNVDDLLQRAGAKIVIVKTQASDASSLADVELLGNASEVVPALLEEPARPR